MVSSTGTKRSSLCLYNLYRPSFDDSKQSYKLITHVFVRNTGLKHYTVSDYEQFQH